ncbi:transient receptor potential cation channel subfamily V member 5-like [Elysia marginata]|uniref:Transient receptor potential cation channel subfamily V member 5-like n=1 Tax=Elysia marginata TaxID=1093978 RepID=A0AAV4FA72_9GAST|nr:transient receptor potential cation channel subfamily V member 5-like [Elysia marginata]
MMSPVEFVSTLNRADLHNGGQKKFVTMAMSFLEKHPADFVKQLRAWIRAGEKKCFHSFCMIRILQFCGKGHLLLDKSEQSILHLTTTFHSCHRLTEEILTVCPDLAVKKRSGEHSGLTALHILVSKDAVEATQHFLSLPAVIQNRQQLMSILADGNRFKKTNLMGQTALSAAVLNFCTPLVVALLEAGANLMDQNSIGDTVLHSLVRYANIFPANREEVIEMMATLQEHILMPKEGDQALWGKRYARKVWFCRNCENMTALQLAATLGEHHIVCFIMDLQWVYRTLYDYNGIFETNLYDITEIDTLAGEAWNQDQSAHQSNCWWKDMLRRLRMALCCSLIAAENNLCGPPVMEKICEVDIASACKIISTPVVTKLINDKWRMCKVVFYLWAFLHLSGMVFMTVYAAYKFKYIDNLQNRSMSESDDETISCPGPTHIVREKSGEKLFIDLACALFFLQSLFTMYLEIIRTFVHRKPWKLHLIHHNGSFRLVLLLKALATFVDCVWYFICPIGNDRTPIVMALLLGWWFNAFFLRPFKIFSFFTVMLMRVLLGDMLRFFSIILIELVSFTLVMYLLFQNNAGDPPEEFDSLLTSFMTMFQLMLGLTEISLLNRANPAWLATTLFVFYIVLTYILLINSLIAMMSITCAEIAGEKANQWKIQRLSVILFLEKLMPCGMARLRGRRLYYHRRQNTDINRTSQREMRYVITDTTNCNKRPLALSVDRSISQDKDDVDTDLGEDFRNRAVIVSCPDDDTPSQPPSPTASLGDTDFSLMRWLSIKEELNTSTDSGPYVELDLVRKPKCPEQDCTLNGVRGSYKPIPNDLDLRNSITEYANCVDINDSPETPVSAKPHLTLRFPGNDEAEYGCFDNVCSEQDLRRPAVYSDPQWVSLLESIRSFDARPKTLCRQSSYMMTRKRATFGGRNRLMSRKIRNELIFEGREKSVDDIYSTPDDFEADQEES